MPDTHERTNAPGFGHSSKADATLFTGTEAERGGGAAGGLTAPWPAPRSPGSRCRPCSAPSSAPAAPGWASALPRPGLRSRRSVSEAAGTGLFPEPPAQAAAHAAAAHGPRRHRPRPGDDGGLGEPDRSRTRGHAHRAVSRCCLPPSPLCPRPRHAEAHGLPTGTRRPPHGPPPEPCRRYLSHT